MLLPDPQDRTHQLLIAVVNATQNQAASTSVTAFVAPRSAVLINLLYFVALLLGLGVALGAMLVKQWARQYNISLNRENLAWERARWRRRKYKGLSKWKLQTIIALLPLFLHAGLLLFLVGTILWVKMLNQTIYFTLLTLMSIGAALYVGFAIIPSFAGDAPFIWPVSSALRTLSRPLRHVVQTMLQDLEKGRYNAEPPPTYILTPDKPRTLNSRQQIPSRYSVEDASVLIQLLRQSDIHEEADAAIEALVNGDWVGITISKLLLRHEDMILRRCQELSASCWDDDGLGLGLPERARRICRFVEWFYYQLSHEDRQCISSWPDPSLATAFLEDCELQDDLEGIVLCYSVISKLEHVRLKKGDTCTLCWSKELDKSRYRNIALASKKPFYKTVDGMQDLQKIISACIWSDTDCVLHYTRINRFEDLEDLTKNLLDDATRSFRTMRGALTYPYPLLGPLLARAEAELEEGDDIRKKWFSILKPLIR
jgi:hypothetical protein